MTIAALVKLKESENKVEFKEAKNNFPFNGGSHIEQKKRRKCFLGYVVALANEEGGYLVLGMDDNHPHKVVSSNFAEGEIGALEDAVYDKLGIRVHINELFDENGLRVVITKIPPRPIGKTLKFEGVPLMRIGDSLRNMSDDEVFRVLSEQEPDFSAKICSDFKITDIDDSAITILKEKYAAKQNNNAFIELSTQQILNDLNLARPEGLTYAALILLGKQEALKKHLPNAQINIEYRQASTQIHFDKRDTFLNPLFLSIDAVWNQINARNLDHKISEGPYKFDIPYFNEDVIRESVLNAIAHRDYTIQSETVIKQFPNQIRIINSGGFPKGVNQGNLLTTNSTPRSRLLTEILEKTGLVERSGQGVDKIFRITLAEGKPLPDYSQSDMFQVELFLNSEIEDEAFTIFISNIQKERDKNNQLGTFKIIALHKVKNGVSNIDMTTLKELEKEFLIKRVGGSASEKYILSDLYYNRKNKPAEIAGFRIIDLEKVLSVFEKNENPKMKDFTLVFNNELSRAKVKYLIDKLVGEIIVKHGSGKGTSYTLKKEINNIDSIINYFKK